MLITEASCVNTSIGQSRLLARCVVVGFVLTGVLLFSVSALPIEAKALCIPFLANEYRRLSWRLSSTELATLQLDTQGRCLLNSHVWHVHRVHFLSGWLMVIDLHNGQQRRRLPFFKDAFSESTYRHLSRVCLAIKV
ncbi:protein YgfX [Enterovibrio norvegicus]|uniref:protein YgfX n=1 Tax=Enterovibrio norvegicus TaxID=188144 RepID=UPI0018EA9D3B|nr:protein YgfX [Enterovibrio norvegicus]